MRQRFKRTLQKVFIIITVPTVSLCATVVLLYIFAPQPVKVPASAANPVPVITHDGAIPIVISPPVKLNIGSINVEAVINPVGLNLAGDMDIDDNPTELAWYKLGPKPGEEGSAVIAGHYGWKNGVASIFNDLNKLVKGDEISVVREDGNTKTFAVTRTAVYAPNQDATDIFKSDDGKAHLNLITCQGTWNNSVQTYSERLVIFADYAE